MVSSRRKVEREADFSLRLKRCCIMQGGVLAEASIR